ncbi:MAG: transposase [Deinococcota bacterium]|nr:transposase [Deinococcota bacterium]
MEKARRVVREYDMSFKLDAVQLVLDEGYSVTKAAERLGISPKNLYHWKRQYLEGRLDPAMKRAQPTEQEAELRRLREENRQLKLEAEILKKASAYFAKQLG